MSKKEQQDPSQFSVTDLDAMKDNATTAVEAFAMRYLSMPRFDIGVEVMDQAQLRDAMGLRSTFESGDPWPAAEKQLLEHGFRWHFLGGMRVMFLKERPDYEPDDGWNDGEEVV
jgi:hypothetical protein